MKIHTYTYACASASVVLVGVVSKSKQLTMAAQILSVDDLCQVIEDIYDAVDKWHNIGMQLNLHESDLKGIESNYPRRGDCLREMVYRWLRTGNATWNMMINALKSRTVGEFYLAEQLNKKYRTPATTHFYMETTERTESESEYA